MNGRILLALALLAAVGCAPAPPPTTTARDLLGPIAARPSDTVEEVRVVAVNMLSPAPPYLRAKVPRGTTIKDPNGLVRGKATALLYIGSLRSDFAKSMKTMMSASKVSAALSPVSGGRWKGRGSVRERPSPPEAGYWLESGPDFLSLRITLADATPEAYEDARALLAAILTSAKAAGS